MFDNKYPYTDFHELNLDWFLAEFKKVHNHVDDLDATVHEFTEFVTNYFNNLDVQEEINHKLDDLVADGTLSRLLQPMFDEFENDILGVVNTQNNKIDVLEGRMDSFTHLTDGSTTGDAELADIRVGVDGTVYDTAGDAVRGQINMVLGDLYALPEYLGYEIQDLANPINQYKFINPNNGNISNVGREGFAVSNFTPLPTGAKIVVLSDTPVNNANIAIIAFYSTSTGGFISAIRPTGQNIIAPIPAGAKYYVVSSNVNSVGTVSDLNTRLLISQPNAVVNIKSSDKYDLIVGDTFELFYKGIIESYADKQLFVGTTCTKGSGYTDKFIFTPTVSEDLILNLALQNEYMQALDSKTVTLSVHPVPTAPETTKNILCVGDSLTVHGEWPKEFHRRLTTSGGNPSGYNLSNINFIGTCVADGVNYEGYGGYTFNSYNTENVSANVKMIYCTGHDKTEADDQHSIYRASNGSTWKIETVYPDKIKIILNSGTPSTFSPSGNLTWVSGGVHTSSIAYTSSENASGNPFWNTETSEVDFTTYAAHVGASSIDYVYVLLGWNSAGSSMDSIKTTVQTFIENVQTAFPDVKIVLMGLEHPSRDGLAANYGSNGTYSKYLNMIKYVHDLDDMYDQVCTEYSNVYHINISGQFDTEHNMPEGTRPVNTRNPETETYQTNGIHPAESGLLQIADAATRSFAGL